MVVVEALPLIRGSCMTHALSTPSDTGMRRNPFFVAPTSSWRWMSPPLVSWPSQPIKRAALAEPVVQRRPALRGACPMRPPAVTCCRPGL